MTRLVEHEFNWRDGVPVDLQLTGSGGERPEIRLVADLYRDTAGTQSSRNMDWMRLDFTEATETVVLLPFGGHLEAEAATSTLTEPNS